VHLGTLAGRVGGVPLGTLAGRVGPSAGPPWPPGL